MGNLSGSNFITDAAALGESQIVVVLKIEPELSGQAEVFSQANGSVGADRTISTDDFIDAREIESLRQFIGAYAHRLHEFSLENFSGVNCKNLLRFGHIGPVSLVYSGMR